MEKNLFSPPAPKLPPTDPRPFSDQLPMDGLKGQPHPETQGNGIGRGDHRPSGMSEGDQCSIGCDHPSWGLPNYPLAMVYAPCQVFHAIYDPVTALSRGTLFTELDLPLGGEQGAQPACCGCRPERRRT